ncbi:hypothetical protein KCN56_01750 [Photobacterium galatheae]|uniref:hypothetical protein n=1 Tax=Photobacterium galatheae TaxID=1654360 RepID=UPI00202CDF78|nr:hypothetical protein [Photobacterium galatheae]MCM0147293.1 hypothetical protein [Photobacterium galatheae]
MMKRLIHVHQAVAFTAFIFLLNGGLSGQTILPVDIDCQREKQAVALTMKSADQRRVVLMMSSAKGNVMHTSVSSSSQSRMVLDSAQFPVMIQVEVSGEVTRLSIAEDCQMTPQSPSIEILSD